MKTVVLLTRFTPIRLVCQTVGSLLWLVLILVQFCTYNDVFDKSPDWINIAIFYITALLVFLFEWWAFKNDRLQCKRPRLAFAAICLTGVMFVGFTFAPPQIPLFQDPLTGTAGLEAQPLYNF